RLSSNVMVIFFIVFIFNYLSIVFIVFSLDKRSKAVNFGVKLYFSSGAYSQYVSIEKYNFVPKVAARTLLPISDQKQ
ncbi:MAG: hypothetical protein RR979_05580, partial [Mucinivorans sp.]